MARPSARASIRYYSGSKSSSRRGRRGKKPCKKKSKKSKAGRGRQERGSGSSEEDSTTTSSSSSPPPSYSKHFKQPGGGKARRPRPRPQRRRRTRILWADSRKPSQKPADTQEEILPSFVVICPIRTCTAHHRREDGGDSPLSPAAAATTAAPPAVVVVFEGGHEGCRGRRDRGGSRRPHCPVDREEGPAQQGVHGEGAEGPEGPPLRPHCHQVLRRAGPSRLRSPKQGRRLAHQEL